jgi:hypothetical protein
MGFPDAYRMLSHIKKYGYITEKHAEIMYRELFLKAHMRVLKQFGHKIKRRKNTDGDYEWYLKG